MIRNEPESVTNLAQTLGRRSDGGIVRPRVSWGEGQTITQGERLLSGSKGAFEVLARTLGRSHRRGSCCCLQYRRLHLAQNEEGQHRREVLVVHPDGGLVGNENQLRAPSNRDRGASGLTGARGRVSTVAAMRQGWLIVARAPWR